MTEEEYSKHFLKGIKKTKNFLLRKGIRETIAEEFAQIAWTRGFEKLQQLRDKKTVFSWVDTIAINLVGTFYRKENRLCQILPDTVSVHIDTVSIDINTILAKLKPKHQKVLRDELEGLTPAEIVASLNHTITEGAIRIRRMKAKQAARAAVGGI